MNLSQIFHRTNKLLTHAERDYYFACCSFANHHTGVAYPKLKTIALRAGILPQNASRLHKILIAKGVIESLSGGFVCKIGYDITNHSDSVSNHPDSFSNTSGEKTTNQDDSLTNHPDTESNHSDSSIRTLSLTKKKKIRTAVKKPEALRTRPDLSDTDYVAWLSSQAENVGIDVPEKFRRMISWCAENKQTPSRLRLLKWLSKEQNDVPMANTPVVTSNPKFTMHDFRNQPLPVMTVTPADD